jgi:chloramphenicol-sensitive protein RarD
LCLETGILFLPAALFLVSLELTGSGSFGHIGLSGSLLLVGTGIVTSVPLLFFGFAAQKIALSSIGLLQYMAPTILLFLGVFVYKEEFPVERLVGFLLIWIALALYMTENMLKRFRSGKKILAAATTGPTAGD